MHRVLQIVDSMATRNVVIMNTETGTIDTCFDDSILVGDKNFSFIIIGNEYMCGIRLFGSLSCNTAGKATVGKTLLCRISKKDVFVGTKIMTQVLVNNDLYYIPQRQVDGIKIGEEFLFRYTRKDLIQVDDVIHPDLVEETE